MRYSLRRYRCGHNYSASSRIGKPAIEKVAHNGAEVAETLFNVTSLAADLGVTPRTIRFYEDKGLITPRRAGATRVYTARDRARMVLILRGKRLGFSLRDIGEFLDLYDADPTQAAQMRQLRGAVRVRIDELEQQLVALDLTLEELREIERQAVATLGDDRPRRQRKRAIVAAPEETIR